jgi:two-component system phosphate regulon sensor histidine kinase PhoR
LLINALKYSADDMPVKVIWKKTTENMIFDVIDQGEGIAAADIPRVTERFYRVDAKRTANIRGTGLGLAIVKHVLIRHGAKLEITSKPGKGSRFRCVFPGSRIC